MDQIYKDVHLKICSEFNLEPIRVDESDNGKPVTQQIFEGLNNATIIIADLTFTRPNCYLEVGFALGRNLDPNTILCCEETYLASHPKHDPNNKIHFDLSGYNIHTWNIANLSEFEEKLRSRIRIRMAFLEKERAEVVSKNSTPSGKKIDHNLMFERIRKNAKGAQNG